MTPTIVGVTSAEATTATVPAGHIVGDILVAFAFRDGNTTNPTVPSPWTTVTNTHDGTSCSASIGWKPCLTNAETSGTWTSATALVIVCLRNADLATPIIRRSDNVGTTNSVTWATLTDSTLLGTGGYKIFGIIAHRSTDVAIEVPPAGATNIHKLDGASADMAVHEMTSDDNWPQTSQTITGTASGWQNTVFAVRGARFDTRNDTYRGVTASRDNTGIISVSG